MARGCYTLAITSWSFVSTQPRSPHLLQRKVCHRPGLAWLLTKSFNLADDFDARSSDELTLRKGDKIELVELDDGFGDGWYLGRHLAKGVTGLFPGGELVRMVGVAQANTRMCSLHNQGTHSLFPSTSSGGHASNIFTCATLFFAKRLQSTIDAFTSEYSAVWIPKSEHGFLVAASKSSIHNNLSTGWSYIR